MISRCSSGALLSRSGRKRPQTPGSFRALTGPLLALTLGLTAAASACQGCRNPNTPSGESHVALDKPTLRIYASSAIAGAIEPCGCSKDQLGGVDHYAALFESEKAAAPAAWMIAAGPLFFLNPELREDERQQSLWKAEAMAQAARRLNLVAWAPGQGDWAAGADTLGKLREMSGAALLAGNLEGAPGAVPTIVRDVAGIKVGLFGLAEPKDRVGRLPPGVTVRPAAEAAKVAIEDLKKQGARILIGVLSIPRGEALRVADAFPEIAVLILGKPAESGETNDSPKPPVLLGHTLVVETSNHLQTTGVVDLYIDPDAAEKEGLVTFQDGGGVARAEELVSLSGRIRDLENKINGWENDRNVKPEDVAARKDDLEKLRAEKAALEATETPVTGSFFRYRLVEIREKLGADAAVKEQLAAFYKRVNEHNKTAFADRKPRPPEAGQAGFIGVDACTDCHDEERKVWDSTPHARAYPTLQKDFKEYNLDCVSCHVTGYGKAGGSTVTHNDKLQNVQCEVCHGPGSLHAKAPTKKDLIVLKPSPETCVSECHHPPHVEGFDPVAKTKLILGPGHGM